MAEAREDDLESKLEGLSFVDKKKLSATKKGRFTRHYTNCALSIKLWEDGPEERGQGDRAKKQLLTV